MAILETIGAEVCYGLHDRKLNFLPHGTTWHRVKLSRGATILKVRRNGMFEHWICQPRGDGYMAPIFRTPIVRGIYNLRRRFGWKRFFMPRFWREVLRA